MPNEKIKQLTKKVDDGHVLVTTLGDLREAAGYGRLGKGVLEELSTQLRGEGIEYFPSDVIDDNPQPRAGDIIRLVKAGEQLGKIVKAVQEPSSTGDELLENLSRDDSAKIIQQIRLLVSAD